MAKKVKTPEEYQAAMEKKVAKRTLFFGTFRKALALFLGIAFTFAMVQIAFTKDAATVSTGGSATGTGVGTDSDSDTDSDFDMDSDFDTDSDTNTGDDSNTGDNSNSGDDSNTDTDNKSQNPNDKADSTGDKTPAKGDNADKNSGSEQKMSKADVVSLINSATGKAASAGYNWSRKCYYTDDGALQVKGSGGKDATDDLNKIIHMVDENASLGGVVGGFLDITENGEPLSAKKAKGSAAAPEGMKDKFLLKGMSLTEGDVAQYRKDGDVYKVQLNSCSDPKKGSNASIAHATNDFVTQEEVSTDIANALGSLSKLIKVESSSIKFKNIVILAEIKDGSLKSLSINYIMDVKSLNLKLTFAGVVGSGKGKVEIKYDNFVY